MFIGDAMRQVILFVALSLNSIFLLYKITISMDLLLFASLLVNIFAMMFYLLTKSSVKSS